MRRAPDLKSPAELRDHMLGTYFGLRIGLGVLGVALPLLVWASGGLFHGVGLEPSISAYYHSETAVRFLTTRDLLVGCLLGAGACLYLYKGYSDRENVALNVAGAAAALVALVPTAAPAAGRDVVGYVHIVAAVLFFVCLAYVSLFRATDTLGLLPPETRRGYVRLYRATGSAMLLSPLGAVGLSLAFGRNQPFETLVFWVEAVGVWAFAAFWFIKTREMRESQAERRALEADLKQAMVPAEAPAERAGGPVLRSREGAAAEPGPPARYEVRVVPADAP